MESNEYLEGWKALQLAGERAGLEGDSMAAYLDAAIDIFNERVEDEEVPFDAFDEGYLTFLNSEVLSDERIVDTLETQNVVPFAISGMGTTEGDPSEAIDIVRLDAVDSTEWTRPRAGTERSESVPDRVRRSEPPPGSSTVARHDFVVKAAVKEALAGHNVSSEFYDALDREVSGMLNDAAARADANGRKTVQPRDL